MNDYPTEAELDLISKWDNDYHALMEYVKDRWKYDVFKRTGNRYRLATMGWSGNEDIIQALQENAMFWIQCWRMSKRGGLYLFEVK